MPVGFRRKRRPVKDRINKVATDILSSPGIRHDVVIIKVTILWNITGHPVPRALKNEQIEYAVVNGRSFLGFMAELQTAKPLCEVADQCRLCRVVLHPGFEIEEIP